LPWLLAIGYWLLPRSGTGEFSLTTSDYRCNLKQHACEKGFSMNNSETKRSINKRDIIVQVSNESGMIQHQVDDVVKRTFDLISNALARGKFVELRNFGTFEVLLTKERVGRNPNNPGSTLKIPPKTRVKFKPGKELRQKVSKLSPTLKQASL
jgi:nucleoid DNA-binding protein